jgi:hypothetical protein
MSAEQLQALNRIIRTGWKNLANDTEGDYDTTIETAKTMLEELEALVETIKPV